MDLINKKNKFLIMARQLNDKQLKIIKPYVDRMYKNFHLYDVTSDEKFLRAISILLCECNAIMIKMLISKKKHIPMYFINEE
ncbi:hypothetical protein [Diatraea saccharalis granulovirus]|uniref:Uncharacterized protein n=1 Tax=Diatraea saccharalis granulovirus TaxID=1675862 RepID=A0A0R7EYT0_9BBAC|nr:hypothetical protein [Diatraea saccharalis granulovirus]AKN80717.1 hypothetical protein [Diatraea saccharalis granulovirus]